MHTEPGPWGPELIGQSRGCSLHVLFMGIRPVKFPELTEIVTSPLLCAAHSRDLDKWVSARPPLRAWRVFAAWGEVGLPPQTPKLSFDVPKGAPVMGRMPVLPAVLALPAAGATVRKDPRELHRKSPKQQVSSGHPPSENGACPEPCPQHRGDISLLHQTGAPGQCLVAEMETPKQEAKVGLCLVSVFFLNLSFLDIS